jgi:hypothetical protein
METAMGPRELRYYIEEIAASLGGIKKPADEKILKKLFEEKQYAEMVKMIRDALRLPVRITIGYVNKGGPKNYGAWIFVNTSKVPLYGTKALEEFELKIFIRKKLLKKFHTLVYAIAHELCHVLLFSIRHKFMYSEQAVDLTTMVSGYDEFYKKGKTYRKNFLNFLSITETGYLKEKEIKTACGILDELRAKK